MKEHFINEIADAMSEVLSFEQMTELNNVLLQVVSRYEIVDDTEKVKVLIQSGDPVIVSLAPSFIANFEGVGIDSMRNALKKLVFYRV